MSPSWKFSTSIMLSEMESRSTLNPISTTATTFSDPSTPRSCVISAPIFSTPCSFGIALLTCCIFPIASSSASSSTPSDGACKIRLFSPDVFTFPTDWAADFVSDIECPSAGYTCTSTSSVEDSVISLSVDSSSSSRKLFSAFGSLVSSVVLVFVSSAIATGSSDPHRV